MAANPKDRPEPEGERRGSYQNDPRYREYYERLRRENERRKEEALRNYEQEIQPMTLDELSSEGWDGTIRRVERPPSSTSGLLRPESKPAPDRAGGSSSNLSNRPPTGGTVHVQRIDPNASGGAFSVDQLQPGAILNFDDGSLAIFKDAVSGKDYALFYFLEPNMTLSPRGIFLEQYDYQCIGQMPLALFEDMKSTNRWSRDCIVFHLFQWEFVRLIPQVGHVVSSQVGRPSTETNPSRPETRSGVTRVTESQSAAPATAALPDRGQVLKINVAGRVWEAVYWAKDEMGHVVAHSTNKKWALMHLDLTRFQDSMELGEMKSPAEIDDIQRHLMNTSGA